MPSASSLIRFSPGPHAAADPDPEERLTVILTTALNGLLRTTQTTGNPLAVELTIQFADTVIALCERAHLLGVSPAGHAPLVLTKAGYWGSTCGYGDPATDVFWVYSDATDDGETLVIDTPCENLYGCFHWPSAVVAYDPPLADDETAPTITLALDGFVGLDGSTETGVRLSMRLILIEPGVTGETELATLNYEQAPHFTGSGTNITVKKSDADPDPDGEGLFALTGRKIADAVNDVTGDYEIWWRIYHGSGDMLYTATCATPDDPETPDDDESQTATLSETVRDRRNAGIGGGFGLFDTTDLMVARVRVEPGPLSFNVLTGSGKTNLGAFQSGIESRIPTSVLTATAGCWYGLLNNQPIALSFGGPSIYAAGRLLQTASGTVLGAAIQSFNGVPSLVYVTGTDTLTLWRRSLVQGFGSVSVGSRSRPFVDGNPSAPWYSFSSDGLSLACLLPRYAPAVTTSVDMLRNGRLFRADVSAQFGAWMTVIAPPHLPPTWTATAAATSAYEAGPPECGQFGNVADWFNQSMTSVIRYDFAWDVLLSFYWSQNELVPVVIPVSLTAARDYDFHASNTDYCKTVYANYQRTEIDEQTLEVSIGSLPVQTSSYVLQKQAVGNVGILDTVSLEKMLKRRFLVANAGSDALSLDGPFCIDHGVVRSGLASVEPTSEDGLTLATIDGGGGNRRVLTETHAPFDVATALGNEQVAVSFYASDDTQAVASLLQAVVKILNIHLRIAPTSNPRASAFPDGDCLTQWVDITGTPITHFNGIEYDAPRFLSNIAPVTPHACLLAPDPASVKPIT
ncbi:hypothetical protein [Thiocystis violascens]|uniref:Uncharacterized protein n=1 Tax=Thiocystis violascens (strain ATCC 17096 / DSM 198 / 6111) TaxID=765911 RepID=I3YGX4_THIV6|nr:hypothetical protein [Thiocystis violascens]AFL76242.1 hypothetical protein Thivi_4440 [Thiocystis violascens DSM 198]